MEETLNISSTEPGIQKCKNCGSIVSGKFCPECGQSTDTRRFSAKTIVHDFMHGFLHIDHILAHTLKALLTKPGVTLRGYLHGERVRYANPFTMILVFGALTSLLMGKVNMESLIVDLNITAKQFVDTESWNFSVKHFTYRVILGIPVYALVSRFFYFKKPFNYTEHLIVNTFIRAMADVFIVIAALILILVQQDTAVLVVKLIVIFVILLYYGWSFSRLFDGRVTVFGFLKGFVCALLSLSIELFLLSLLIMD